MNQKTQMIELLKETRHLLQRGWCQRAWARDIQGNPVDFTSNEAECFCFMGAILRAVVNLDTPPSIRDRAEDFLRSVISANGEVGGLVLFNDAEDRTLSEVLKILDEAISSVETSYECT